MNNMNFDEMNKIRRLQRQKVMYLIDHAENWGINTDGYGEIGVNQSNGNVFLWFEDYDFCLYMSIFCKLQESDIRVIWTNPNNGKEIEKTLNEFSNLEDIEKWARDLYLSDEENNEE